MNTTTSKTIRVQAVAAFMGLLLTCGTAVVYSAEPPVKAGEANPQAADPVEFSRDIKPIFRARCYECHATGNAENGLDLAVGANGLAGGEHGPVIVPGESNKSILIQLVSGADPDRAMPPDGERLSAQEISLLTRWIDQGASWPADADTMDARMERAKEHWSFRRLRDVQVPSTADGSSQHPIDAFVTKRLEEHGLHRAAPADARTLVRRIYFDVVGLPPTPEVVAQFVDAYTADRDQAISELVDRVIASRGYGERWGRHWLDVIRYADSDGQEADRDRPDAYHFRDFVVRAFNDDLPFDTFLQWQLAGDEIAPNHADAVAATGFLTAGTHTVLADTFLEEERLRNRYNELDDIVSTLGSAMLGLTIGCARCHDHKYDAIRASDYYQLLGVFHSGDRKRGKLPDGRSGLFFAESTSDRKTTYLFRRGDFNDREIEVELGFPQLVGADRSADEYWQIARSQGNGMSTTFQRRALAEWLTDVEFGAGVLAARVIVNRMWQHHFGEGLVRTPNDFGVRGETPMQGELLEWLTQQFIREGWKMKPLHRLILTSATYQQATSGDPTSLVKASEIDPQNRLLWRRTPRRLEAEAIRDAMLAVSGSLSDVPYGPGFKPPIPPEAILARNLQEGGYPANAKDSPETHRRSIYMFHKRVVPYPLFQAFDRPDQLQSCGRREQTTVAPQALALLNDSFVRARAQDFATRLLAHNSDLTQIVETAFQKSLGRAPTTSECLASVRFLSEQLRIRKERGEDGNELSAVTDFCHAIYGLNEFIYVD